MKKIGIFTHYYKSTNYGGLLQSYALVQYLTKNNLNAYQILFKQKITFKWFLKKVFDSFVNIVFHPVSFIALTKRNCKTKKFRNSIPHSRKIYTEKNISSIADKYDYFITGSDQVWHPHCINAGYCLDFATNSIKISYAASLSTTKIPESLLPYYSRFLNNINYISVRENAGKEVIGSVTKKDISVCCDPVFLLSKKQWEVIMKPITNEKKFIFCYFLGENKIPRLAAEYISKKFGYEIIYFKFPLGKITKSFGNNFKSVNITSKINISLPEFLTYIEKAEYVLTDSFHGLAFSLIFGSKFIVFNREIFEDGMETRIDDLLKNVGMTDMFFRNSSKINFDQFFSNLHFETNGLLKYSETEIKFSKDFLEKCIG